MADNKNTTHASDVIGATKDAVNKITGLLDGIAEILYNITDGRNIAEIIILAAGGTLSVTAFAQKINDLVKGTNEEEMMARQMIRDYYVRIVEDYAKKGGKAAKDGIVAAASAISKKWTEANEADKKKGDALLTSAADRFDTRPRLKFLGDLVRPETVTAS